MVVLVVCVTIAVLLLGILIGFWVGVRYAFRNLLYIWLARMTPEEMEELAQRAAQERRENA